MSTRSEQLDRIFRPVSRGEAPHLHAMIEDLCARAGVEKPTLCFIDSNGVSNALHKMHLDWQASAMHMDKPRLNLGPKIRALFGHHHASSAVSDELKAILAHEITHMKHNDAALWKMRAWEQSPFALGTASIVGTWYYQHLKDAEAVSRAAGKSEETIQADTKTAWEASAPKAGESEQLGALGVIHPGVAAARSIAGGLLGLSTGFGLYALHNRHIEFRADRGAATLLGDGKPMAWALKTLHNAAVEAFQRIPKAAVDEHLKSKGPLRRIYDSFSHPPTVERIERLTTWSR